MARVIAGPDACTDDTALSPGTSLTSPDRAHVVLKEQYFSDAVGIITMQIQSNNSPFTTRRKGANSQFCGGRSPCLLLYPFISSQMVGTKVNAYGSTAAHVSRCVVLRV